MTIWTDQITYHATIAKGVGIICNAKNTALIKL